MEIHSSADIWSALRPVVQEKGWFFQRFEDAAQGGIPDTYIGCKPNSTWIEIKYNEDGFRPGQLRFAFEAGSKGENVQCIRWRRGMFEVYDMHKIAINALSAGDHARLHCLHTKTPDPETALLAAITNGYQP